MIKVGIISGGGKLPLTIGLNLKKSKFDIVFFCIENYCDTKLYKNHLYEIISINSLTKILQILKKYEIEKIIMVGNVKRPSIKDIDFDFNTLRLIKNFALDTKGDDKLLSSISTFFSNKGFSFLDWKKECKDLFITNELLTNKKPSKIALSNKEKGLKTFELIGKADLAQSIIVQNKIILGIEAAEGTDELLKRCYHYKKKGDKGILLKLSKYHQNSNLDIPVIGLDTLINIKKFDYEGVFLEKNNCIIVDKEKTIDFANDNNIFISSVTKN